MQVFRTIAQFTYFRLYGLCVKVEHIFMHIFWLYFWGNFLKMAMKSSIIGLDSYIIPHFKVNMIRLLLASRLSRIIYYTRGIIGSHFTTF